MGLRRAAGGLVLATSLAACSLLTGASDLEIDPSFDAGVEGDGSSGDSQGNFVDGSIGDGARGPQTDGGKDAGADASTRVRTVTFENGSLTGILGADSVTGNARIESFSPIDGKHSMRADKAGNVQVAFAPLGEIYVTFLVSMDNIGFGDPVLARISGGASAPSPAVELSIVSQTSRWQIVVGPTTFGSTVAVDSTGGAVRVGLHLRRGSGTQALIELFVAARSAPFGAAAISASANGVGLATTVQLGSVGNDNMKLGVDDLLIDSASMPSP